jgi:hypothetical protein
MDFVNATTLAAGWTMGFDRDGRELVIVAIKATFTIPPDGEEPELTDAQTPLTEADVFTGEPGLSAALYETDYAQRKPLCDVLVNGSAYAPSEKVARQVQVGVRVGSIAKTFNVVGDRNWRTGVFGIRASEPTPFGVMPISYDNAFGGVDASGGDPTNVKTFLANPVGRGYADREAHIDGMPLPNTEEVGVSVVAPNGSYRPMALGPIGRSWPPRVEYAGTYDKNWLDEQAPFWPDDFDYRYFQAAPPDQQMAYPRGGEEVVLKNLTPDGYVTFRLPVVSMPVWFIPHQGKDTRLDGVIDTIVIEPDLGRFSITWRAVQPMRRSCFDMRQVIAGQMSEAWQRTRKYGNKPYYKGLAELVQARRGRSPR